MRLRTRRRQALGLFFWTFSALSAIFGALQTYREKLRPGVLSPGFFRAFCDGHVTVTRAAVREASAA